MFLSRLIETNGGCENQSVSQSVSQSIIILLGFDFTPVPNSGHTNGEGKSVLERELAIISA